jgi:Xaa-Pro aminopeptidase
VRVRSLSAHALRARRLAIARRWDLDRGAVVVASGLPVPIAGTDQFHDFHAHPEHYYLSGMSEPAQVLAFDPAEGWALFAHEPSEDERVWTGAGLSLDDQRDISGIDRVTPASDLGRWLERRRGEPLAVLGNRDLLQHPEAYGIDNWASLELDLDEELTARLSDAVSESRRAKDEVELDLMRKAAEATRRGHLAGIRAARPGMTERELQVEFEVEFFRGGAERTAYGSIVGTGSNAAVLHFAPSARQLRDGDLVLVDAGAEYRGYASDVTRTFPAGQRFTPEQRDLYELVLHVQEEGIRGAVPGKEYRDLHLEASERLAAGLVDLGLMRGSPAGLVEQDATALFFPHGLGHMLGLATHDAGGCLAGRKRSERPTLRFLRADLPLQPGYVVTIEPGLYFIPALLTDPARRERYRDAVNWERVDRVLDLGGIRIEDDVVVTERGPEVLSAEIPKSVAAIEELRREALER